jgi:hypothetical protein
MQQILIVTFLSSWEVRQKDTCSISPQDSILTKKLWALADDPDWSLVQSDKTGLWVPMCITDYIADMKVHINHYCTEIPRTRLDSIHKDTKAFMEEINHLVSDGQRQFLNSWINTKKIPTLRLSVKDHKPHNPNSRHPTRLIVSAHNFTQCLSKIASTSIKVTFRHKAIQFEKHTLKNLLALKQCFEELDFKQERVKIVSIDIKDMYPQCNFKAVSNAVNYFATTLPDLKWQRTNKCLDILQFTMGDTIVTFQDKYYKYGVDADPNRDGLTIGRFELAFLADLEA